MTSTNPLTTACGRFGLGPDPSGDWSARDARARVEAQIGVSAETGLDPKLPTGQVNLRWWREDRDVARARRIQLAGASRANAPGAMEATGMAPAGMAPNGMAPAGMAPGEPEAPAASAEMAAPAKAPAQRWVRAGEELRARLRRVLEHRDALPERLVLFWADYFTVAQEKAGLGALSGPFEREALRPNIVAPFRVLLTRAVTHPAMLVYLDNNISFGPNSRAAKGGERGLNENLAREILELHTLGSQGGYTQKDVTTFAAVLSGWVMMGNPASDAFGRTVFDARRHEPGPKVILGKTYPDLGEGQLALVLDDLARHPATARHVATRMCRSFISETPPPALVARMAETFRRTDGDLAEVVRVMVRSDEAWEAPARKVRSPVEFVYLVSRLLDVVPDRPPVERALAAMGQPYHRAPSPKGWPDEDNAWATADGIKTRLDWAQSVAAAFHPRADIRQLVDGPLDGMLSDETRTTVLQAESQEQALTLLIMSPELQRR